MLVCTKELKKRLSHLLLALVIAVLHVKTTYAETAQTGPSNSASTNDDTDKAETEPLIKCSDPGDSSNSLVIDNKEDRIASIKRFSSSISKIATHVQNQANQECASAKLGKAYVFGIYNLTVEGENYSKDTIGSEPYSQISGEATFCCLAGIRLKK